MCRRSAVLQCVIVVATAAIAAGGAAAQAQTSVSDTPEAFGVALRKWARDYEVERAIIVVRRQGSIVYRAAIGGADPGQPVHLASLSKAITGACVATLIRDGKLTFDAPVASTLAGFMARNGAAGDPRFRHVTVAQLLTHRAGFGAKREDHTAAPRLADYLRRNPASEPPSPASLSRVLTQPLLHAPGTKYVYTNTAYLALGAIIEEAAGKPYAPYCRGTVLAPLGLGGDLEPRWRVTWSYGGWRMSGEHYLAFLDLFDARDQRLGAVPKAWMLDPAGKRISPQSEVWYGLGTFVRKVDGGVSHHHFGSWTYNGMGVDGPLRTSFLTLAVRRADGTAWFVHVSPKPPRSEDDRPGVELNRALAETYRGVKRWN
jgi:CubicO group peptidase (beta-lactamase class C family)